MSAGSRDEARLLGLRQRAAAAALVQQLAPGARFLPAATALAAALAAEGHDLDAAAHGDARALAGRLERAVLSHRRPATWHVLAVVFERLAEQLEAEAASVPVAAALRRSALEAWRLLAHEGVYLRTLLGRMARAEETASIDAYVAGRPAEVLARWVHDAQPALLSGAPRGAVMLRVLRELERESELAEPAREAREALLDALLSPLRHEDQERLAGRADTEERISGLARWAEVWRRTDNDSYFALRALEPLVDFGWELRSVGKYTLLRDLYEPFRPLLDVLETEVRRGGPAASYASLVGDGFVQLASTELAATAQITDCERALRVCPRHKLAESMLAFYLAQLGIRMMDDARNLVTPELADRLEGFIVRARTLDPTDARLAVFVERYRAATGRVP